MKDNTEQRDHISDAPKMVPSPEGVEIPAGTWREIETEALRKGLRRTPQYLPAIGETCRMSGPNCDDADGYTWGDVEVLWRDDLFIVTRVKGRWPTVTKLELALFEPAIDATPTTPVVGVHEAAELALMYLETGFVECERCGNEVPTKTLDAVWQLQEGLSPPTVSEVVAEGMEEVEESHGDGADDIHAWINRAYGTHPRDVSRCFSRFNMVVAYRAGEAAALSRLTAQPAPSGGEGELKLISREQDDDCGCPEEYWEAYGLSIHMHLSTTEASNAHADGGDWGEAEMTVRTGSIDHDRAVILAWARDLMNPAALAALRQPHAGGGE